MVAQRIRIVAVSVFVAVSVMSCVKKAAPATSVQEAPKNDYDSNGVSWWNLKTMKYNDILPMKRLDPIPWAGDYWATGKGGIAFRWQTQDRSSADYKTYLYKIPTSVEVTKMSTADIAKLSPSEKYDIWMGRTNIADAGTETSRQRRLVLAKAKFNVDNFKKDEIPFWTGICNGWAVAALREKNPTQPVILQSPNGQTVTFYPDDLKALMSQFYFDWEDQVNIRRLGSMCRQEKPATDATGRIIDADCRDVNPMSLHMAVAQFLSKGTPFVFDQSKGDQVWNQPVSGYKVFMKEVRAKDASYANAAPGTTKLVDVTMILEFLQEAQPSIAGLEDKEMEGFVARNTYNYTLELDNNLNILGGEWKPDSNIPDFLWYPAAQVSDSVMPSGYPLSYARLSQLFAEATKNKPTAPALNPSLPVPPTPVPTTVPVPAVVTAPVAPAGTRTLAAGMVLLQTAGSNIALEENARTGSRPIMMSGLTITRLGSALAGGAIIRTTSGDSSSTSPNLVSFVVARTARVFVVVDKRATNTSWLSGLGFAKKPDDGEFGVGANLVMASPMQVFEKRFNAHDTVTIPGQSINGDTGALTNYFVIIHDGN